MSQCYSCSQKTIDYFNKQGNTVSIGVVDISKAFDSVSVPGLLCTLLNKGINHFVIKTIDSWLSNSSILVNCCHSLSAPVRVSAGVRQGGILSPLLFSLYIDT